MMGVKRSLQTPYDGPYRVLKRHYKRYTLDISGQTKVVALDRFKPAYIECDHTSDTSIDTNISPSLDNPKSSDALTPKSQSQQPLRIHSRRRVHWPRCLADYSLLT